MPTPVHIGVIAGCKQQFETWLRHETIGTRGRGVYSYTQCQWVSEDEELVITFLRSLDRARGIRFHLIQRVGTWYDTHEWGSQGGENLERLMERLY